MMNPPPARRAYSPQGRRERTMRIRTRSLEIVIAGALLASCGGSDAATAGKAAASPKGSTEVQLLAGGCFWCTEAAFDDVAGVVDVVSGYTGGHKPNPTYEEVSEGDTG